MFEKIHIIIPLFAGIIVTTVSYIQKVDLNSMYFRLIITIVLFYSIGVILKSKLQKIFDESLFDDLEIYDVNNDKEETSKEEPSVLNS